VSRTPILNRANPPATSSRSTSIVLLHILANAVKFTQTPLPPASRPIEFERKKRSVRPAWHC
jgi:hypothetical protein